MSDYEDIDQNEDIEELDQEETVIGAKGSGQDWHVPEWVNKLVERMLNFTADFVINATPDEDVATWVRGPKAYWMAFNFNKYAVNLFFI